MKLFEYLCESFNIDVFMYGVNVLLQASLRSTWYATQIQWRHSR